MTVDRTTQDRTGQDRTGQEKTGQDRTARYRQLCTNKESIAASISIPVLHHINLKAAPPVFSPCLVLYYSS